MKGGKGIAHGIAAVLIFVIDGDGRIAQLGAFSPGDKLAFPAVGDKYGDGIVAGYNAARGRYGDALLYRLKRVGRVGTGISDDHLGVICRQFAVRLIAVIGGGSGAPVAVDSGDDHAGGVK